MGGGAGRDANEDVVFGEFEKQEFGGGAGVFFGTMFDIDGRICDAPGDEAEGTVGIEAIGAGEFEGIEGGETTAGATADVDETTTGAEFGGDFLSGRGDGGG